MRSVRDALARTYLAIDPRTLGALRIATALLLIGDLVRRIPDARWFFTEAGLIPNSVVAGQSSLSFFLWLDTPGEVALGFALCGVAYLALLAGVFTRVAHVASLICVVSLHNRVSILENGGDVAMALLVAWTVFLPTGRRFSVDALLRSMRRHPENDHLDLDRRPPPDTAPVVSIAVLGLLLQLSVIYFFNAVHKGAPWASSHVIHYVLHQDRIVTTLGWAIRDHLPVLADRALSWWTLVVEAAAPVLILTPYQRVQARRLAIALLPALHVGMATMLNVGLFSPTMCVYFVALISPEDWDLLRERLRRPSRARRVLFDAGCGICFQTVRILSRLDAYRLLELVPNHDVERRPRGVDDALVERTIVVEDPATGRTTTRAEAFAEILAALPLGGPLAVALRLPGLRSIAGRAYDLVAHNRQAISARLGLAACGLPGPAPAVAPAGPADPPARPWYSFPLGLLREATVLLLIAACASQVLVENRAIPRWLRLEQPQVLSRIVAAGRFFQGWSMFAPTPPLVDGLSMVDAVTADGRRVDPLNELASGWRGEPMSAVPERLGQNQFWCDYVNRIWQPRQAYLWPALRRFLLGYHERTGRPEDRIVSFEAAWLEDRSPPPGRTEATDVHRRTFLRWSEKGRDVPLVRTSD